jgi:hypothetical protein
MNFNVRSKIKIYLFHHHTTLQEGRNFRHFGVMVQSEKCMVFLWDRSHL